MKARIVFENRPVAGPDAHRARHYLAALGVYDPDFEPCLLTLQASDRGRLLSQYQQYQYQGHDASVIMVADSGGVVQIVGE